MNQAVDENCPLITTILPTYKRPERLRKAIQSVLNQTYPHFQLYILDNASEDSTFSVVKELSENDPRIHYHCHPSNIGAAENFQYGLDRIKTPFFSFLSDDDFLLPEFYETTLQGFKDYPDAIFSAGAVIDVDEEGQVVDVVFSRWPEKLYFSPPDGLLEMIGKYSNWTGVLFKKEIIEKIGPLDLKLKAIDVDYVFRAAARFPFTISKKPCAVFVQHSSSYSGTHGLKLIWPGWKIMMEKMNEAALPLEVKQLLREKMRRDLDKLLVMNVLRCLEKKQFAQAAEVMAVYLQNGSHRWIKLILAMTIKICQAVPAAQKFLVFLLKTRRKGSRKAHQSIDLVGIRSLGR